MPAAGLSASLDHDPKVSAGQSDGNTPFVREFRAREPASHRESFIAEVWTSIDTEHIFALSNTHLGKALIACFH
jgi:hypothetical protein